MIKRLLQINNNEDLYNAIALFLNRDIEQAQFNDILFTLKSIPTGKTELFNDVIIDIDIHLVTTEDNLCSISIPYNIYSGTLSRDVEDKINEYRLKAKQGA